jgi:N-acetylglucosamine-6-phosphate deacetylase
MPSRVPLDGLTSSHKAMITKFTNCRLLQGNSLIEQDLWVSSVTGKIVQSQEAFYDQHVTPDEIVDLGGRIISPGFIDVQINGAFGMDFSVIKDDTGKYESVLRDVNRRLIKTGVTSYLPTLTSQRSEVYHKVRLFCKCSRPQLLML